jgi:hypothetical protein
MKDDAAVEAMMTRALERQPAVVVPEDFAAKMRAALPMQRRVRERRSAGRIVAFVGAAVLMVALCVLAPYARPSFENVAFDLELLMVAEMAAVAAWLAMRRDGI